MVAVNAIMQVRRDTAANLASENAVYAAGEIVFETDTRRIKVGDGSTVYSGLGFSTVQVAGTFTNYSDLLSDTGLTYEPGGAGSVAAGDLIYAGAGYWEVAAFDASDHHVTTAGGVKLYEAGPCFSLRSRLVAAHARNVTAGRSVPAGTVWSDPNVSYVYDGSSTAISDLQGWTWHGQQEPEHFGAAGDGVTNDTTACQAWLDSIDGTRVEVWNVRGYYLIDELEITSETSKTFVGGRWKKAYNTPGTTEHIFKIRTSNNVTFRDALFEGTSDTSATYDATNRLGAFDIQTSAFIKFLDCTFRKFSSYGIIAQNLTGGTYTEGLFVHGCVFEEFPYDATTPYQAGIILRGDGEYSTITGNRFFDIPSAVRFDDGANCLFAHNIVMDLNGGYGSDRAAIYQLYDAASNSGKLQIVHNKFNHIETGQAVIWIYGDPAKPQNSCIIADNEFLVSGDATNGRLVILNDAPHSRITGNSFRPKSVVSGHGVIRLNDSEDCIIEHNYFESADYAVETSMSTDCFIGKNIYRNMTSGKFIANGSGSFVATAGRTLGFRVASTGAASTPFDDSAFTASRVATGHFRLTHSIGNTNYAVSVTNDNSTAAPETRISVVRSATEINIYVNDSAGSALNISMLVQVTLGVDCEYAL